MYERTRIPSRFVPVCPGPPAANCRDAPGRTPGQWERGLTLYFVVVVFSACNANLFNNMAECCKPAELKKSIQNLQGASDGFHPHYCLVTFASCMLKHTCPFTSDIDHV